MHNRSEPCANCHITTEVGPDFRCVVCTKPCPEVIPFDENDKFVLGWKDIEYEVVITRGEPLALTKRPGSIQFVAYRLYEWDKDDEHVYLTKNVNTTDQRTTKRDDAEIFMRGEIRWSGCSNVYYRPEQQFHYAHFCSRQDAAAPGTIMTRLYELLDVLQELWT